jgi:hypothetical protein
VRHSVKRSIYTMAICVFVAGCGIQSHKAKQIEERDKQIVELKSQRMQLAKRKSDLLAERKQANGKETPAQAADWKEQINRLDAELQQNDVELALAQKERQKELGESQ